MAELSGPDGGITVDTAAGLAVEEVDGCAGERLFKNQNVGRGRSDIAAAFNDETCVREAAFSIVRGLQRSRIRRNYAASSPRQ